MKRILKRGAAVAGVLLVLAAGLLLAQDASGNFHTVVPGQFYRSGQLSAGQLMEFQSAYGIRTIINLRGSNPQSAWYRREVKASHDLGIAHVDFRMSAGVLLTKDRAEQLIRIMEKARKPILVHCQGGADRSGLVSSLYMAAVRKAGESASESELSIRYGHIGIPYLSRTYAMDRSWQHLEPWLGFGKS